MSNIKYGSQAYPWEMNVAKFAGKVPHMCDVLVSAGFTGLEAEIVMLGEYYNDWQRMKTLLEEKNVQFAALAIHEDWVHPEETPEEFTRTNVAIEFLTHFPTAKLLIGYCASDPVREHNLHEKQENQMKCVKAISQRCFEKGIVPVFHPNSAPNSVFRTEEDYKFMFDKLYQTSCGWCPDVGHMLNGNIDSLKLIKNNRERVWHVHFKDMDKNHTFATMGTGIGDFKPIVKYLEDTDYRGWIMTEDESPDAVLDSDGVVMADGKYMKSIQN